LIVDWAIQAAEALHGFGAGNGVLDQDLKQMFQLPLLGPSGAITGVSRPLLKFSGGSSGLV
jgi:hypothetical protein